VSWVFVSRKWDPIQQSHPSKLPFSKSMFAGHCANDKGAQQERKMTIIKIIIFDG
jgi:hypothetical protein